MANKHEIVLTNKALSLLRDMLFGAGWKQSDNKETAARRQYQADRLLYAVLPEPPEGPMQPDPIPGSNPPSFRPSDMAAFNKAHEAWAKDGAHKSELSDKQLELVKCAIEFYVKAGSMPSTRQAGELLRIFKVGTPEVGESE